MKRFLKRVSAFACIIVIMSHAHADDRNNLLGVWKLVSLEYELKTTGERIAPWGKHPSGYLIFTAPARMMAIVAAEDRKVAKNDQERAALFQTLSAYTGSYRLEQDKWITKVEVCGNPALDGTEQVRSYRLDGDRLDVLTDWTPLENLPGASIPGNPIVRAILVWERVRQ